MKYRKETTKNLLKNGKTWAEVAKYFKISPEHLKKVASPNMSERDLASMDKLSKKNGGCSLEELADSPISEKDESTAVPVHLTKRQQLTMQVNAAKQEESSKADAASKAKKAANTAQQRLEHLLEDVAAKELELEKLKRDIATQQEFVKKANNRAETLSQAAQTAAKNVLALENELASLHKKVVFRDAPWEKSDTIEVLANPAQEQYVTPEDIFSALAKALSAKEFVKPTWSIQDSYKLAGQLNRYMTYIENNPDIEVTVVTGAISKQFL